MRKYIVWLMRRGNVRIKIITIIIIITYYIAPTTGVKKLRVWSYQKNTSLAGGSSVFWNVILYYRYAHGGGDSHLNAFCCRQLITWLFNTTIIILLCTYYVCIINVMFRRGTRNNYTRPSVMTMLSPYLHIWCVIITFCFHHACFVSSSLKMTNRSFCTIAANDFNNTVITMYIRPDTRKVQSIT